MAPSPPTRSWKESDRFVPRVVVRPALRFVGVEAAGAAAMLLAALVALVWANSPWDGGYQRFLTTPVVVRLGRVVNIETDLHGLVNDGLMTLFFLLAGLEIKGQLVAGELRDRRAAALPALAALGGIVVPAAIFLAFNAGHAGARGWGIPVATDIAFAVAVVTLAGSRVPPGARIFILTLAVVDDVGAIAVIAVFYAEDVRVAWLGLAALTVIVTVAVQRRRVRAMAPFVVLGAICWYGLYQAGVEAAIAGVIFGLLAPLERLENRLNLWVAFAIVPLFALLNAGVRLQASSLDGRVVMGVLLGLVVGKTVGVLGGAWLAVRLRAGRLPTGVTWRQMGGLAVTAGIGFTVALFVTGLSFTAPSLIASAKIGILAGSTIAGVLGLCLLRALGANAATNDGTRAETAETPSFGGAEGVSS